MRQPKMFLDVEIDVKWKHPIGEYRIIEARNGAIMIQRKVERTFWGHTVSTTWMLCDKVGHANINLSGFWEPFEYPNLEEAKKAIERFERPEPKVLYP